MFQNENLKRLKELTDKLCLSENKKCNECECKELVKEIKKLFNSEVKNIKTAISEKEKLECYEKMCFAMTNLLTETKE